MVEGRGGSGHCLQGNIIVLCWGQKEKRKRKKTQTLNAMRGVNFSYM
jgi:hypothetical protein